MIKTDKIRGRKVIGELHLKIKFYFYFFYHILIHYKSNETNKLLAIYQVFFHCWLKVMELNIKWIYTTCHLK